MIFQLSGSLLLSECGIWVQKGLQGLEGFERKDSSIQGILKMNWIEAISMEQFDELLEAGVENFWHIRKAIMLLLCSIASWPKKDYGWCMFSLSPIGLMPLGTGRWLILASIPFICTIARSVRSSQYVFKGQCTEEYCSVSSVIFFCLKITTLPLGE